LHQQNGRLASADRCPLDLGPELLHPGPLEIIGRVGFGLGQQAERGVERAGVQVG
jgi:hypothetical protein